VEQTLRHELSVQRKRRRLMLAAAIVAPTILCLPASVSAEGLLDFFFGGGQKPQQHQAPQANVFDPFGLNQQAPQPPSSRPAIAGSGPAFCVRSCDGKYFPLMRGSASPVQMCQAFCPASPTKVFFGSTIDSAYAANGERYADSENAFAYRKALRADCTCNGRNPAGLAPIDLALDTSLRSGDVVATTDGLVVFSGVRIGNGQAAEFTPIAAYPGLTADLRARLNEMKVAPVRADMIASEAPAADVTSGITPTATTPKPSSRDKRAEAN
jgi:Protein of unknown function (DUF2865)